MNLPTLSLDPPNNSIPIELRNFFEAVLMRAIADYVGFGTKYVEGDDVIYKGVTHWIFKDPSTDFLSFLFLCDVLQSDPDKLRSLILRFSELPNNKIRKRVS